MKNLKLLFLFSLCLISLFSCNDGSKVMTSESLDLSSNCIESSIIRLRLDETKTVVVDFCILENKLEDISFSLVDAIDTDSEGILFLTNGIPESGEVYPMLLLAEIENFSDPDEVLAQAAPLPYPPDDYEETCECKAITIVETNERSQLDLCPIFGFQTKNGKRGALCAESECSYCSMIIQFATGPENTPFEYRSSLIVLPQQQ